jgi:hypothetical protein
VVGNKVFLLDDSENNEQLELDSVITLDYNQINPDSPSSNSEQPMRIASIQFNTVNFIGMLKFSPLLKVTRRAAKVHTRPLGILRIRDI